MFFTGALAVVSLSAAADHVVEINGIATGMSPDAKVVVGNKSSYGEAAYSSFRYDVATEEMQWLTNGTDYMGSHLDGGRFSAITDNGIIVGTIRNPEMRIVSEVGPYYAPGKKAPSLTNLSDDMDGVAISSAAIWRGGKPYVLGTGPYPIEAFSDFTDGSAGIGVTPDGNTVLGNIVSAWMPIEACCWEYDAATDKYEYRPLARPAEAQMTELNATCAAGFPAIGQISVNTGDDNMRVPVYWTSADECFVVEVPDTGDGVYGIYPNCISADGRYMVVNVNGSFPKVYICDLETGELESVPLPEGTTDAMGFTVTNDANIILKVQDSTWSSYNYYYDHASGSLAPFAEYLSDVLGEYSLFDSLKDASVVATSGDGRNLILKTGQYAANTWLLTMDNPQLHICAAPMTVNIYHNSPSSLAVEFEGISAVPSGCVLKGYELYVDGKLVKTFEATETGGEFTAEVADAALGQNHKASVCTLYTKNGEDKKSAMSPEANAYVSADMTLIDIINFDDAIADSQGNFGWDNDGWTSKVNYGVPGDFISWYITAGDFENRTPSICTVAASLEPWSVTFESHFMDATDEDTFFVDFRYLLRLVNTADQILTSDYLDVEASTDGKNWITVGSVNASEVVPTQWQTFHADLGKELGGKIFQLRINAHGEGIGQVMWMVDDICIDDDFYGETPTGLRYDAQEKSAKLMWHNAYGMHDLSYLDNSGILWDYNVGAEGAPLIGAIELTEAQTKPFVGEYITAVSTFLYDDPSIEQAAPTEAEAIVYADGKEVASASFTSDFSTVEQAVAWLDTPVAIEEGKTYRVGVRISGYAKEQAPMYYQASMASVPGRSDLYSEDEGKTWHNASEIVMSATNPYGYCVWPIRAHISATADVEAQDPYEVVYYDVFRDGEKVNGGAVYEPHPWVTLMAPYEGSYTIQTHYANGIISPMSEPVVISAWNGVNEVKFTLDVVAGKGTITIVGETLGATLYDMSGKVAAAVKGNVINGLASGVYILKADTPSGTETYKVIVK